nr:retrovirus-related Pol polyprotein from transposon TNT 1-94 [Tanacetum cinerariifolium]
MTTGTKFDVVKFDGTRDFALWKIKMKALGVHSALILCFGDQVLKEVNKETTVSVIWTNLETLYMTRSLANRLYLKKKLYTFHMHPDMRFGAKRRENGRVCDVECIKEVFQKKPRSESKSSRSESEEMSEIDIEKLTMEQYLGLVRTKRWMGRIPVGSINTWDLLKKVIILRNCPPSRSAKRLEDIRNFRQEGNETLYQAWESGAILEMTAIGALVAIQEMADHSQKWHDGAC